MKKKSLFITTLALSLLLVSAYINRGNLILRWYALKKPCGMFFVDQNRPWNPSQKAGVIRACDLYKRTGLWVQFLSPLLLTLDEGKGGAHTTRNSITFNMADVGDEATFYSVALHEIAHVIDIRSDGLSTKFEWLIYTDWRCPDINNLDSCTHRCKQYPDKAFYCSYKDFDTLPSRFGTVDYDPEQTDVSVNPSEDFAESSRYFLTANDALALTSKLRCDYFGRLYKDLDQDPCFDCDPKTICK